MLLLWCYCYSVTVTTIVLLLVLLLQCYYYSVTVTVLAHIVVGYSTRQESGRETPSTPSTPQASSINGTDDEKISHVGPEAALLMSENDRLKTAVEQR